MTRYRIVPYGLDGWRIQRRGWFLWKHIDDWGRPSATMNVVYRSVDDAMHSIDRFIADAHVERGKREAIAARARNERPVTYP